MTVGSRGAETKSSPKSHVSSSGNELSRHSLVPTIMSTTSSLLPDNGK